MKTPQPPRLAERLLLFFLKESLVEEVLGDLDEKFYQTLQKHSLRKARLNYYYQVFNYLRPFAFKYFKSNSIIMTMIRHNFRISYRILVKNKVFSMINIGGLAMGMIVAILIALWIHDEVTFNTSHDNYDRIVQVYRKDINDDGTIGINNSLTGQLGVTIKENYPDYFDKVVMTFFRSRAQLLSVGKQSFDQIGYFFQPDAPEMLSLEMLAGDVRGIDDPSGILLSESLAKKFFGDQNPMGEFVTLNLKADLQVTGIYKDLPGNSTFSSASFMASLELVYNEQNPYVWDNYNIRIYAQLKEGVELSTASAAIKDTMKPHLDSDRSMELFLLPMKDWHLNAEFKDGQQVTSNRKQFVQLYGIIGVFVLMLAFINFVNLNTARYQNRVKEVGIRKTVGSQRTQLIYQFLSESILYAFASFLLSLGIVWMILPWFNTISDKTLSIPWGSPFMWLTGILFTLLSALVAGSYPAFFLSSFGPLKALSGTLKQGIAGVRLRQVLVVFQFMISIMLMIGTITVYQQIQHAKQRPVGYNQKDLIVVRGRSGEFYEKYDVLRQELKRTGMVEEVATANYPLMNTLGNNGGFSLRETGEPLRVTFNTIFATPEYGKTTQWELVAGRDFSRDLADESANVIVSELAVEKMGLINPVGTEIQSRWPYNGRKNFTIIGVVRDMIKGSPYEDPIPLMLFPTKQANTFMFIRLNPDIRYMEALMAIQEQFESVLPGHPFNYEFVDDEYMTKFRAEEKIGSLATLFSSLAILISCLGLFGLSAFITEQRTKEVGIRKVLGASVPALWKLLSKDFSVLVILSAALAVPLASILLNRWLDSYQYRITLEWWMFALAIAGGLLVAILTVSYHSLKTSMGNPVDALRSE